MHVETQVAINFLISFLYNKLPRRRVNQFGEELAAAMKIKFEGHWYPEKPYKGSAFRAIRTSPPLDPVFELAAREAGMDLNDIQENLPQELSIWIDPGEVSYRMSEKGPVKILYSESESIDDRKSDREVTRTFNPEAQCFKPIDSITSQFNAITVANNPINPIVTSSGMAVNGAAGVGVPVPAFNGESSSPPYKSATSTNSTNGYLPNKTSTQMTFTTATFAQTKFGSTKLKSNNKRGQRMSPTEFSNYIKQRALLQQQATMNVAVAQQVSMNGLSHQQLLANNVFNGSGSASNGSPHNSRSLSPNMGQLDSPGSYLLMAAGGNSPTAGSPNGGANFTGLQNGFTTPTSSSGSSNMRNAGFGASGLLDANYINDLIGNGFGGKGSSPAVPQAPQQMSMSRYASFLQEKDSPYVSSPATTGQHSPSNFAASFGNAGSSETGTVSSGSAASANSSATKAFDNINNLNLNGVSYSNQYQHLLVAN